jgi:hypothetical protein
MIQQQKNALRERSHVLERYESALKRIRDNNWAELGGPPKWLSEIAREALE